MTLAAVSQLLGARVAGNWRREDAELVLTDFWSAPDLDRRVAEEFRNATLRVPISQSDLGIVGAALDARPRVSIASELPPANGSGMWLRRFGADRSVAVPHVMGGVAVEVAAVALRGSSDDEVIRLLATLFHR